MNRIIALGILVLFFFGCASVIRDPAAIVDKNNFRFELYGAGSFSTRNYKYQLINLDQLRQKKIEFDSHFILDPEAETKISAWQQAFHQYFLRVKSENLERKTDFSFVYRKLTVNIDFDNLQNLEKSLEALDSEADSNLRLRKKVEIISSFNERFKDPIEFKVEILTLPLLALSYLSSYTVPVKSGNPLKVLGSSFWQPRTELEVDMRMGPGKFDVSRLKNETCVYTGPKKGFGVHPGLKVKCGGTKLKVKFGAETHSAPLNSRLYHRLGYNVPAIHYAETLTLAYDRKIFLEFNSRKTNFVRINFAGKTIKTWESPKDFDGMSYVQSFQLKDGSVIKAQDEDLSKRLLYSYDTDPRDYSESNIKKDFAEQLESITFGASAVVEEIGEEIGPWKYSALDHSDRPELKGLLLVGSWTGNFDLRKDNTKLAWDKKTGELKHFISDPGSGLVDQGHIFSGGKSISNLRWSTTNEMNDEDGTSSAVDVKLRTNVKHSLFRNLSFQDGQWMAKINGSVSEDEIAEAIISSGFSAAEFLLLREKLVSIQQKYIQHFSLTAEFQTKLRPIDKFLNFSQEQLEVRLKNGRTYMLPARGISLVRGSLIYPSR